MPVIRLFTMTALGFFACCFAAVAVAADKDDADQPHGSLPDGFQLVYSETFDNEKSLQEFRFSDNQAWRWSSEGKSGGALELFQQSKYKTDYRSPFNIGLLGKFQFEDFVMELDMRQTGKEYGHRDLCLFFGFQSPTEFYYTHIATKPDANAHNVFVVDNAARKSFLKIPEQGIDWGNDWKHVRLERIDNAIRVYYEDMKEPILSGTNDRFAYGAVGFGSFDDTGKVDNVRIWAKSTKPFTEPLFSK